MIKVYLPIFDSLQSPVLTLNPTWRKFYPTEKVTLKCEIQTGQTEWSYLWYRDGAAINSELSGEDEYTIPALDQSHRGRYSCRGGLPGRDVYTEMSKDVTLIVDGEAPKPLLTRDPPSGEIFTGDTVTLSCRFVTNPVGMEYLWFKDTLEEALTSTDSSSTDGSSYTIHSAAVSHGGEYWCGARRGKPAFYTPYSDTLQLSITARPQAVLTLETAWTEIFRSDSLTLRCQVEGSSAEWNYTWYRDGQHFPLDPRADRLTLSSGNNSYSSEYKCRGNRTGQPSYTEISEGFRAHIGEFHSFFQAINEMCLTQDHFLHHPSSARGEHSV
ncbi:putative high affinity immunoglobulin gamma Fc receptor IC [Anguilla rostrata]|uniref:putative high affinity immunoglobulin gamma Fc receptor IC n=1 Tax=Anguilla rostrata TaxID=7938 RepID=UPI0030D36221